MHVSTGFWLAGDRQSGNNDSSVDKIIHPPTMHHVVISLEWIEMSICFTADSVMQRASRELVSLVRTSEVSMLVNEVCSHSHGPPATARAR